MQHKTVFTMPNLSGARYKIYYTQIRIIMSDKPNGVPGAHSAPAVEAKNVVAYLCVRGQPLTSGQRPLLYALWSPGRFCMRRRILGSFESRF